MRRSSACRELTLVPPTKLGAPRTCKGGASPHRGRGDTSPVRITGPAGDLLAERTLDPTSAGPSVWRRTPAFETDDQVPTTIVTQRSYDLRRVAWCARFSGHATVADLCGLQRPAPTVTAAAAGTGISSIVIFCWRGSGSLTAAEDNIAITTPNSATLGGWPNAFVSAHSTPSETTRRQGSRSSRPQSQKPPGSNASANRVPARPRSPPGSPTTSLGQQRQRRASLRPLSVSGGV